MMEAVRTSETSVYFNETIRYISEASHLHTCCRENLESHILHWLSGAVTGKDNEDISLESIMLNLFSGSETLDFAMINFTTALPKKHISESELSTFGSTRPSRNRDNKFCATEMHQSLLFLYSETLASELSHTQVKVRKEIVGSTMDRRRLDK
jgi:hypothetical protein